MNTEQLRKEFEAWFHSDENHFYMGKIPLARVAYYAAAQSRDELIEKLVKALETCSWDYMNDDRENEQRYDATLVEQALAEAKAQGYWE